MWHNVSHSIVILQYAHFRPQFLVRCNVSTSVIVFFEERHSFSIVSSFYFDIEVIQRWISFSLYRLTVWATCNKHLHIYTTYTLSEWFFACCCSCCCNCSAKCWSVWHCRSCLETVVGGKCQDDCCQSNGTALAYPTACSLQKCTAPSNRFQLLPPFFMGEEEEEKNSMPNISFSPLLYTKKKRVPFRGVVMIDR